MSRLWPGRTALPFLITPSSSSSASRGCTAARSGAKGRFSHFPADNMKPIQQRVQRCAWLVQGEWTVPSASHADYERETGLTIGDGPVEDA